MNIPVFLLLCIFFLAAFGHHTWAAEIRARVVDGAGRPLPDATIEVQLTDKAADGKVIQVQRLTLSSDREGLVKATYDEKRTAKEDLWVNIGKEGYESYSTDLRAEYVLRRSFGPRDVRRIARLTREVQIAELKELLLGEYRGENREEDPQELVFIYYRDLRSALRALLADPKVAMRAAGLLSFVGAPEDLRLVLQHTPPPKEGLWENRWAYGAACALLEPTTEAEWAFLRRCALGQYEDGWVDAGAIQSLKLIASPRALEILKEAGAKNTDRQEAVLRAVKYIDSKPPPLSNSNLVEAGNAVAQAIKIGSWERNKEPRLNDEGDMALIDCEFLTGRDLLTYTATFHHLDGIWKLRGVRETRQALLAIPPAREVFVGSWHGYSDSRLEFGRLELKEDGTGLLAISYLPESPPQRYRVTQWSQRRFQLDITVEPAEPDAERITLENVTHGLGALELELHGSSWKRKMTLLQEGEFEKRSAAAKTSLESISKEKKRE